MTLIDRKPQAFLILALSLASTICAVQPTRADNLPYQDSSLPVEVRIDDLVGRLTLEEKVRLVHASSKFGAGGIPRLGLRPLMTDDGPQGVREESSHDSFEPAGRSDDFATAMPVGIGLAATWDQALVERCAEVIGEEARARDKQVILGPGINIQRSPLNGRTYDYYGEDPWLSGRLAVAYVRGMQSRGVVACLKHFAANNQETDRDSVDVQVDDRTLHEIYLPAFEAGVREGGALAVMGAYNQFRGDFCSENGLLLNHILKKDWGFKGAVISDWGATHDTSKAVENGLDLEMGTKGSYDAYFMAQPYLRGLEEGTFNKADLDDKVRRNLRMLLFAEAKALPGAINTPAHQAVALKCAEDGIVLLKNQNHLLPLSLHSVRTIAVIGDNAVKTFAAGFNSAGVKVFHEVTTLEGVVERVDGAADVIFSQGYRQPEMKRVRERNKAGVRTAEQVLSSARETADLADRAVRAAKSADVVLFVAGLAHGAFGDDEGTDRKDLLLPSGQGTLISRIANANPRMVVILISGSPVEMEPWLGSVNSVIECWYGGSKAGAAIAAVLFGDVNPSGKLPCTFPRRLADSPAHASGSPAQFPGVNGKVFYNEGLLVGYRWFDTKHIQPLFEFGYGLSYTSFAYSNLRVRPVGHGAEVEFELSNTGERAGADVAQIYVHEEHAPVFRPEKELKGFTKIFLAPGEHRVVRVPLTQRSFAHYSPDSGKWVSDANAYSILVGGSSRDIRLQTSFEIVQRSETD